MLTVDQYARIRQLRSEGLALRQIARQLGHSTTTIIKALRHPVPPPYTRTAPRPAPSFGPFRTIVDAILLTDQTAPRKQQHTAIQIYRRLVTEHGYAGSYSPIQRYLRDRRRAARARFVPPDDRSCEKSMPIDIVPAAPSSGLAWVLRLLLGKERPPPDLNDGFSDTEVLHHAVRTGGLKRRTKALVVLADRRGLSQRDIARLLVLSSTTVNRYCREYREGGVEHLFKAHARINTKRDSTTVRDAVFEVLHSPPSAHDINRTTWKMDDLRRVLMERGVDVSLRTIRAIIRDAGYRWRNAREVLTSNDPEYREKLKRVTAVLSALKPGERFFSIDEFGPFAVKMQGGCWPGRARCPPSPSSRSRRARSS